MLQYFNIVSGLFDQIHQMLDHYVFDAYHAFAKALQIPIALSMTIYIVILGYSISQGWVSLSVRGLVKIALKLSIVYSLAMNWDFFSHVVIDFIGEGSNQLGGILLQSHKQFQSLHSTHGVEDALQSTLIHFTKIGYWFWKRGAWHSISPYFEGIVVWGSGISLVIFALIQLIVSYVALSLLFVLTPLFISFTIFRVTQSLFDRWVGYIVSYALSIVLVSVLLGFVLNMADLAVSGISDKNLMSLLIGTFVPIVLVCFVSVALIKRVSVMAFGIGQSFSTIAASQKWGSLLGESLSIHSISSLKIEAQEEIKKDAYAFLKRKLRGS